MYVVATGCGVWADTENLGGWSRATGITLPPVVAAQDETESKILKDFMIKASSAATKCSKPGINLGSTCTAPTCEDGAWGHGRRGTVDRSRDVVPLHQFEGGSSCFS